MQTTTRSMQTQYRIQAILSAFTAQQGRYVRRRDRAFPARSYPRRHNAPPLRRRYELRPALYPRRKPYLLCQGQAEPRRSLRYAGIFALAKEGIAMLR